MGFGGVIVCDGCQVKQFNGYSHDGPHSSTLAEVLAMLAALALLPADARVTIKSDSQAAINTLRNLQQCGLNDGLRNSPIEYIARWAKCLWFEESNVSRKTSFEWVKGHSGIELNEMADRLAGAAHQLNEEPWSLHLGPVPGQPYWLAVTEFDTPLQPNMTCRMQDEEWSEECCTGRFRPRPGTFESRKRPYGTV